jgi:hypothetical protein
MYTHICAAGSLADDALRFTGEFEQPPKIICLTDTPFRFRHDNYTTMRPPLHAVNIARTVNGN